MRRGVWLALLVTLLALGLVIPAGAQDSGLDPEDDMPPDVSVDNDGIRIRVIWMTPDGVVHEWVYYYADGGDEPAGTAYHSLYLPYGTRPEGSGWSDSQPVDLDGDGIIDGAFYQMRHPVSPMAVIAKAKKTDVNAEVLLSMMALPNPAWCPVGCETGRVSNHRAICSS